MNIMIKRIIGLIVLNLSAMGIYAQGNTFVYSDTVCVHQDVIIKNAIQDASSYYWGTCSAWLERMPKGRELVKNGALKGPTPLTLEQDGENYHLFTVNYDAGFELIRLDFDNDISKVPTQVNLTNFGGAIPAKCTGIDIVKNGANWIGYVIGGIGTATHLTRLEFGTSLSNIPTVTDLGNLSGLLISPQDIHLFSDNGNWYAYYFNGLSGNLIRLDFGASLASIPTLNDLGNPANALSFPTSIRVVEQAGSFYGFVTNRLNSTLTRLDFGTSLLNAPFVFNLGNFGGAIDFPRDMGIAYDDNRFYGYVSNEADNNLVILKFGTNISNVPTATVTPNFASFQGPRHVSDFVRVKDNVYGFVSNYQTNSISQIHYDSSTNATILKDTTANIPVYSYTEPGVYNILLETTNADGSVREQQHRITVLPIPRMDLTNDTLICQGDTLFMVANSNSLDSVLWDPVYNLLYQVDTTSVYVHPQEDYTYNVKMWWSYGCYIDTMINVAVSKIQADAGPDRWVTDGATTTLGGENQSQGYQFSYKWTPDLFFEQNIKDVPYPIVRVQDTLQYYVVEVTNLDGCKRYDTVGVYAFCGDVACPNAFNPFSPDPGNRTFGILNYQLSKLDHFRVFNRFGEMVFETTNPREKWDGYYKGTLQSMGTYVWVAEGICNNGRRIKRSGNVTLLR
jgi:hypothetical protein